MEDHEPVEVNPYVSATPNGDRPFSSQRARGYSVAALFFCITICAILTAAARHIIRLESFRFQGDVAGGIAAIATLLGGIVGLFHHRRLRGGLLGLFVGAITGAFVGTIGGTDQFVVPVVVCLSASLILVVSAVVFRYLSAASVASRDLSGDE